MPPHTHTNRKCQHSCWMSEETQLSSHTSRGPHNISHLEMFFFLLFKFVLWKFHAKESGHILDSTSRPIPLFYSPNFVPLFLLPNPSSLMHAAHVVFGVRLSKGAWSTYQGYTLKEYWQSLSQQLLVVSSSRSLRMGICANLPFLSWNFVWLNFVQVPYILSQPLWAHMCNCPAVSGKQCLPVVIHYLWPLWSVVTFFCIDSWAFGEQGVL